MVFLYQLIDVYFNIYLLQWEVMVHMLFLFFITTWIFGAHSGFVPNPGLKKCHIIALINTNF